MTNLPTPPSLLFLPPSAYQVPHGQRKTHGMAIASLALAIVWIGGIGSIVAIVLGIISQKKIKKSTNAKGGTSVARAGIIIGVTGLIIAIIFWTAVFTGGNGVNTSSLSYVDGNNYASANYSNATAESVLCKSSNVPSGYNPTLWIRGCLDGWATARFAINNNPGFPGLNSGS